MAGGADHLLLDSVRRRLRQPAGWVAVVLRLSRLAPPAPRPHHRRIARVLMEDAARRHEGQVFVLGNGDLLLLCRAGDERRPAGSLRVASPAALPEVLARLLRADVPDPRDAIAFWPLESAGEALMTYATERVSAAGRPAPVEPRAPPGGPAGAADIVAAALAAPDVAELLRRQTAILLAEDGIRPLFHEVRFSMPAFDARHGLAARTEADPFLFRHLAERLDARLMALVTHAIDRNPALDPTRAAAPRLHLNLTLASLASDGFAALSALLAGRGVALGIELPVLEACADPDRYERARARLRGMGMPLVLDSVSHPALLLARIAALGPDLVKLAWSPRLAEPEALREGAERRLLQEIGPDRVVLHHAETEAALRWGLERGIRRFQGRHVDAMLGALRLSICPHARGCTLQQCIGRAAAADAARRHDCRNHALLDAGGPEQRPVVRAAEPAAVPA